MFPTILSALGASIDGDRLGLGVSLFSGRKTLCEEFGKEYIETELEKYLEFYYPPQKTPSIGPADPHVRGLLR